MKKRIVLSFTLILLFSNINLNAQWDNLGSGIDAVPRIIWSIHAVDQDTVWAITGYKITDFTPVFEFTKTTDGGVTWEPGILDIPDNLYHFDIFAFDSQTAWITTADEQDPISGKVFKTTDGGITWIEQSSGFTEFNETPASIYFWNTNEGVAFGATCYTNYNDQIAIYTTINGGDTWNKVIGTDMPVQLPGEGICFGSGNSNYAVAGDTIWFFSSFNRVFKSFNKGLSWEVIQVDLAGTFAISIAFKDAYNGMIVGGRYNNPNRAATTTDGGVNWIPISIPNNVTAWEMEYIPGTMGTYLVHNTWDPGDDIMVTYNDGQDWEIISSNTNISCVEFLSPTVGFGGGFVTNANIGGMYKWNSDIFDEPVGIKETIQKNETLQIYPVPAINYININNPENFAGNRTCQIFDAQGKVLGEKEILNDQTIKINDLQEGFYFIKTIVNNKVYSGRFIKH